MHFGHPPQEAEEKDPEMPQNAQKRPGRWQTPEDEMFWEGDPDQRAWMACGHVEADRLLGVSGVQANLPRQAPSTLQSRVGAAKKKDPKFFPAPSDPEELMPSLKKESKNFGCL